jgi:hypothetical protein
MSWWLFWCVDDCVDDSVLMCWWLCWWLCWSADVLTCRCVSWCVDVLMYWWLCRCVDVLMRKRSSNSLCASIWRVGGCVYGFWGNSCHTSVAHRQQFATTPNTSHTNTMSSTQSSRCQHNVVNTSTPQRNHHQHINTSTHQHNVINTVINTSTPTQSSTQCHQHINTSTHQHNVINTSTNTVINTSTQSSTQSSIRQHSHQHINTPTDIPIRSLNVTQEAVWNLVSSILGGGILALPYAMGQVGLIIGCVGFLVIGVLNVFSLQLLCDCARMIREKGLSSFLSHTHTQHYHCDPARQGNLRLFKSSSRTQHIQRTTHTRTQDEKKRCFV